VLSNFVQDRNPFNLSAPPAWWLQRLYDYDNQLVVIPSRQDAVYRLARKTWDRPGIQLMADIHREKDTAMLAHYGLVPVTTIIGAGIWGENIFHALRARDIWAHGGAEKFVKAEEDAEAEAKRKQQAEIRDDLWMRSGDAWRSYQARTGQRSKVDTRTGRRTPTAPPTSSSTAGLGITITG